MEKSCFKMFYIMIINILLILKKTDSLNIEGYYWREYAGKVPSDALAGGIDYNGNPIFMGQIFQNGKITPAKIYPDDNKAYYGYGKEHSGTENIKILCSQHPERFVWIKTKHDEIHLLTKHHIVLSGYHPGKTMYFGRVMYGRETSVGKVGAGINENRGLYITQNGEEINFHLFEILTYNETITTQHIDVRAN
ncbi:hypothetical protein ILUMI_11734 [Ignelater luminosus]|uniref:Uncharacterized protein n=1 Tax=Ignelater luminosus TaxID=2038154 RepID=A0A8K0D4F0_IGNLU|nr:hypothetical protein ILUMI_11734 [Ignelater luminosus]